MHGTFWVEFLALTRSSCSCAIIGMLASRAWVSGCAWLVTLVGCPGVQLLLPTVAMCTTADIAAGTLGASRVAPLLALLRQAPSAFHSGVVALPLPR